MPTANKRHIDAQRDNVQHNELDHVRSHIRLYDGALIAFSGGVDSSVVAKLAKQVLGDAAVAVTVNNGMLRHRELEHATAVAKTIGIRHLSIPFDPLGVPQIRRNDPKRCYYCKKYAFRSLRGLAAELDLDTVMDGTNASDLNTYRPGLKALSELGVVSPLISHTKEEVRRFARMLELPNADVPSHACLLTSFPYGTSVTKERVERLRKAESALQAIGIATGKVRDHDDLARIEIDKQDARGILEHRSAIAEAFSTLGFIYVTLDLEWLRSGSMDVALNAPKPKSSPNDELIDK